MTCLQSARASVSVIKLQILYHNKLFIIRQVTVIEGIDMQLDIRIKIRQLDTRQLGYFK